MDENKDSGKLSKPAQFLLASAYGLQNLPITHLLKQQYTENSITMMISSTNIHSPFPC